MQSWLPLHPNPPPPSPPPFLNPSQTPKYARFMFKTSCKCAEMFNPCHVAMHEVGSVAMVTGGHISSVVVVCMTTRQGAIVITLQVHY